MTDQSSDRLLTGIEKLQALREKAIRDREAARQAGIARARSEQAAATPIEQTPAQPYESSTAHTPEPQPPAAPQPPLSPPDTPIAPAYGAPPAPIDIPPTTLTPVQNPAVGPYVPPLGGEQPDAPAAAPLAAELTELRQTLPELEALVERLEALKRGQPVERTTEAPAPTELPPTTLTPPIPDTSRPYIPSFGEPRTPAGPVQHNYYSSQEVLDRLQIDEEELKRLVSNAELRAFRVGSRMQFRAEDVDNLKKSLEIEPTITLTDEDPDTVINIGDIMGGPRQPIIFDTTRPASGQTPSEPAPAQDSVSRNRDIISRAEEILEARQQARTAEPVDSPAVPDFGSRSHDDEAAASRRYDGESNSDEEELDDLDLDDADSDIQHSGTESDEIPLLLHESPSDEAELEPETNDADDLRAPRVFDDSSSADESAELDETPEPAQPRTTLQDLTDDTPPAPGTLPPIDVPPAVVVSPAASATPASPPAPVSLPLAGSGVAAPALPLQELPDDPSLVSLAQSTQTPTEGTMTQQPTNPTDPTTTAAAQAAPTSSVAPAPASTQAPAATSAPAIVDPATANSAGSSSASSAGSPAGPVPPAPVDPQVLHATIMAQQALAAANRPITPAPATVDPATANPAGSSSASSASSSSAGSSSAPSASGSSVQPNGSSSAGSSSAQPPAGNVQNTQVPPGPVRPAQRRNGCCGALAACGCLAIAAASVIGLSIGGYKLYQNRQLTGTAPIATDVAPIATYTTLDAALTAVKGAGTDVGQLLPIIGGVRGSTALSLDERIGATHQASIAVPTTMTIARFGETVTVDGIAQVHTGALGQLDSYVIEKFTALQGKTANEVLREARAITTLGYTVKQNGNTVVVELNGAIDNFLKSQGQMVLELKNGTLDSIAVREDQTVNGTQLNSDLQNRGTIGWIEGWRVESRGGAQVDLTGTDGAYVRQLLQADYNVTTAANTVLIFGDAHGQNYAWTNEGRGVALGHRDLAAEARMNSALTSARTGNFVGLHQAYANGSEAQKAEARNVVLAYLRSNDFTGRAYVGVRHIRQGPQRELGISSALGTITATDLARAVEQNKLDVDDVLEALAERPSQFVPASARVRGEDDVRAEARRYEALIDRNWVDMGVLGMNNDLAPYVKRANGTSIRSWDGLHRELGDAQGGGENGHLRLYFRIGN